MKVNILMSTYNGQAFLAEQIESIRSQTFKDWQLLIRDDGSSDKTREIIESYVQKDERISFINANDCRNIGVINSFYQLLKYEEADYYFFSDQDDVWLEDKVARQLQVLTNERTDIPIMVYMDLKVVDSQLRVTHESMIATQSHHANTLLRQELTENTVTGGVSALNHCLAELWTDTQELLMHDWYLALIASALGKLIYIDRPGELYRQHDNNVLGARTLQKRLKNWLNPQALVSKYWYLIRSSQKQAKHLLKLDLAEDNRALVEAYVGILQQPMWRRVMTLKRYGFAKNRWFHTLVFRTLIITKFGYRRNS
ncbi:glycosyltransferase family 2 protein [Streptococcus sp. zg-JUN1979]|uniref:glycosyltransferase family 2 protein n=1 Tax=Streptococcus sp. zg-JUN1979 TaxID=3391450 RepID=UPI0039A53479